MPLELGVFLAAKKFGGAKQSKKRCIILDRAPYRYQSFISDIAGQDIHSHGGDLGQLILEIASWLRAEAKNSMVPGGQVIAAEFATFKAAIPKICIDRKLATDELTYLDYKAIATEWISLIR